MTKLKPEMDNKKVGGSSSVRLSRINVGLTKGECKSGRCRRWCCRKRSRPLKQPPRDSPSAHSTSSGGASTPNSAPPGSFFDTHHRLAEEASPRRRSDSLDDRLAQPMFNQRFVDAYIQRHRHRVCLLSALSLIWKYGIF